MDGFYGTQRLIRCSGRGPRGRRTDRRRPARRRRRLSAGTAARRCGACSWWRRHRDAGQAASGPAPSRSSSPASSTSRPSRRCRGGSRPPKRGSPPLLVIDLAQLEFVDSSACAWRCWPTTGPALQAAGWPSAWAPDTPCACSRRSASWTSSTSCRCRRRTTRRSTARDADDRGAGHAARAVELPPVVRSVPAARHVVAQLLAAWAADAFRDDAILLVSELVTNVVRHVSGQVALRVEMALSEPGCTWRSIDSSPAAADTRAP